MANEISRITQNQLDNEIFVEMRKIFHFSKLNPRSVLIFLYAASTV